jgi:phage tail protein X
MLTVIYGVPTAGKTFTLEKLIETLGVTKKTYNHDNVLLTDTDDILSRVMMATTELGYRVNDYNLFWDYWKAASEEVHSRGERIVENIVEAYKEINDVHYIVFTNLQTITPDIAFKRTASSLVDIWKTREAEKNAKRVIPRDISVLPDWVKNYSPHAYQPRCPQIILGEGEYMSDYMDDIKNVLSWKNLWQELKLSGGAHREKR